MTVLLIFAAWVLVAIPLCVVLGCSIAANDRADRRRDPQYDRLARASFGARIPTVDHDWTCGGQPRNDTDPLPGLTARQRVNHSTN